MDDKASLGRRHIFALAMLGTSLRSADIERDKSEECTTLGTFTRQLKVDHSRPFLRLDLQRCTGMYPVTNLEIAP